MARRQIFPAVSSYAANLARDAAALSAAGAENAPQLKQAVKIAELCKELAESTDRLECVLVQTHDVDGIFERAGSYSGNVRPAMQAVRTAADALEKLVSKAAWPFPGYEELLFRL